MKKIYPFLLCLVCLCYFSFFMIGTEVCANYTDQSSIGILSNDPNGFCDLRWGEDLTDVKNEYKTKLIGYKSGTAHYALMIPEAKGEMYLRGPVLIFAIFWDGKLRGIKIPLMGNYNLFIQPLSRLYGTPKYDKGIYWWKGLSTFMFLRLINPDKNDGMIYLVDASKNIKT